MLSDSLPSAENSLSLADSPLVGTFTISGLPLVLLLYGKPIMAGDLTILVLCSLAAALLIGLAFFTLVSRRMQPDREILQGIQCRGFYFVFQPVIATINGKISCIETLLRWTHHEIGTISPDRFISYAEITDTIAPLTRHLFELVSRDSSTLRVALPQDTGLSLNIPPNHLADNCFYDDVSAWFEAMPQNHFNYPFEITERTALYENSTQKVFNWIHNQGICIAVDDFRIGHSALICLDKFSFEYLKVDRGFIEHVRNSILNSPVLEAILSLAGKLGVFTVAEGWKPANNPRG